MAPCREYRPPAGLESMVACLWEREPAEERRQRVVPDGCVDLLFPCAGDLEQVTLLAQALHPTLAVA